MNKRLGVAVFSLLVISGVARCGGELDSNSVLEKFKNAITWTPKANKQYQFYTYHLTTKFATLYVGYKILKNMFGSNGDGKKTHHKN